VFLARVFVLTAWARQCGHPVSPQIPVFQAMDALILDGERQRVIKAAVGITFSVVLTETGKGAYALTSSMLLLLTHLPVFSFGSGEKGQLGNGRTGEHIITGNKTAFDIEPEPSEQRDSTFIGNITG